MLIANVTLEMVQDGADHTASGDGLKTIYEKTDPVKGGSKNYYISLRVYNSGSVKREDLCFRFNATELYVSDIANRLLGTWPPL